MNIILYLILLLAFFLSTACSSSEGRLQPINVAPEQLTSTFYKNDTAILKSENLRFFVLGEWSEKGGYILEISIENPTASQQSFDVGDILLTGDRLEKAETYLRRNGVEDPYAGGDAEKNLVIVKPSEKKKLYVQFRQEMKKEEYYAAGRKSDKVKIAVNSVSTDTSVEFEAVSTSDMKPIS